MVRNNQLFVPQAVKCRLDIDKEELKAAPESIVQYLKEEFPDIKVSFQVFSSLLPLDNVLRLLCETAPKLKFPNSKQSKCYATPRTLSTQDTRTVYVTVILLRSLDLTTYSNFTILVFDIELQD